MEVAKTLGTSPIEVELAEKRGRLIRWMAEQKLDAIVLSRHENIAWATAGLADVRVGLLRETGSASLLFTKDGQGHSLTTNNEAARMEAEEFVNLGFEPLLQPWYANDVAASIRKIAGSGKVAGDMPIGATAALSLLELRQSLTDGEVERYRSLGRDVARAAAAVLMLVEPGMSERAVQALLAQRLIVQGILPSVYLIAMDARARSYRHPVPRAGVLKHLALLGLCARRGGLTVAMTRFVHFGAMPSEFSEKMTAVAQVNAQLLEATRENATSDALFRVAESAYASLGYAGEERMHHQGGATGYLEREWVARPGGTERVQAQQAFAWNPNLQGAKVEDTLLLRSGSIELLTGTPELPVVTTKVGAREYRSADVLER